MLFFEAQEVSKQFVNHLALDKVSIQVPEKSIFGLLGPNGAGKTTLIRIINQITAPDSGRLLLNGEPLRPKHTRRIGYLPEERGLYKKMKVGEQALYLAQLKGLDKTTARKRLKQLFEKFEIDAWWNRKVEELSKGMQQKLQFIVTIIHQPDLLIFDEPFSGFDPINVNLLKDEILQLQKNGATIIFSTHNMASVEEVCEHIALINNSKKILEGRVSDIKKKFRNHTFAVELEALSKPLEAILPDEFSLLSCITAADGRIETRIQCTPATSPNTLLQYLIPHAELISFHEEFPSMNDIFIQQVQAENKNTHKNMQS